MKNTFKAITLLCAAVAAFASSPALAQSYGAAGSVYILTGDEMSQWCGEVPFQTGDTIQIQSISQRDAPCTSRSSLYSISVKVALAPSDVGLPGAVAIVASNDNEGFGYYADGAWHSMAGLRAKAYASYEVMPSYIDVQLSRDAFQQCLDRGSFDIWVGYGVLSMDNRNRIERFHALKNPKLSPEDLAYSYVRKDARDHHKYAKVVTVNCSTPSNNGYM